MRPAALWDNFEWETALQQVIVAAVILLVTWILAKVVRAAFAKLAPKVGFLQKAGADGESLGSSLGQIAALLIWMFGLVAVLSVFKLGQVLTPIQELLNGVMGFLPKLIGAGLVFVVGALLARVVRDLLTTALGTVPFEKWLGRADRAAREHDPTNAAATPGRIGEAYAARTGEQSSQSAPTAQIPRLIATVAYALIMIVITIAALDILAIETLSGPAQEMLTTMFDAIPAIIAAGVVLAIGVLIARFAADILGQLLEGLGLDRSLRSIDVLPADKSATPVIVKVIQVAIVLFFAVMAAQALGFPQITRFLSEVLSLGGRVVFGAGIIAAGFFVATLLAKLVGGQSAASGTVVRYATIVLFAAMGLKFMGIADSIIELGFGALVVGGAAAAALAFGLGGRDAAARQLERISDKSGKTEA